MEVETIAVCGVPLVIECDWNIGIGGSLWTIGRLMVEYFARNSVEREQVRGKRIVELGSGTGLVGLAMSLMSPAHVVLTDLPSHVTLLQSNLDRNATVIPTDTSVEVVVLDWNTVTKDDVEQLKPLDWIIGTDIAYSPSFYGPLLRTMELLVDDHTHIFLGLGRHDTDMRFFQMLVDSGFEYYKIADDLVPEEYRGKDFGLFDIRKRPPFI